MDAAQRKLLGENVRARREAAKLSLDVLYARMTHLLPEAMWGSTEMIRRLERGTLDRPNPFWLAAIAKALECTVRDLSKELAADLDFLVKLAAEVTPQSIAEGRPGRPSRAQ